MFNIVLYVQSLMEQVQHALIHNAYAIIRDRMASSAPTMRLPPLKLATLNFISSTQHTTHIKTLWSQLHQLSPSPLSAPQEMRASWRKALWNHNNRIRRAAALEQLTSNAYLRKFPHMRHLQPQDYALSTAASHRPSLPKIHNMTLRSDVQRGISMQPGPNMRTPSHIRQR